MTQINEQPWVPAELAAKLFPGVRVSVRRSGECRGLLLPTGDYEGHIANEGARGTIFDISEGRGWPGHPYLVRFANEWATSYGWFAAIELIPLDDEVRQR